MTNQTDQLFNRLDRFNREYSAKITPEIEQSLKDVFILREHMEDPDDLGRLMSELGVIEKYIKALLKDATDYFLIELKDEIGRYRKDYDMSTDVEKS